MDVITLIFMIIMETVLRLQDCSLLPTMARQFTKGETLDMVLRIIWEVDVRHFSKRLNKRLNNKTTQDSLCIRAEEHLQEGKNNTGLWPLQN